MIPKGAEGSLCFDVGFPVEMYPLTALVFGSFTETASIFRTAFKHYKIMDNRIRH